MPLPRPCLGCGALAGGSRCADCQLPATSRPSSTKRGYDAAWRRLSKRARRLQPWCTECGSTDNLTVDHNPRAWELIEAGHTPTLQWFADGLLSVLCLKCNIAAGNARGDNVTRTYPEPAGITTGKGVR